jgi:hypothetical protein
MAVTLYRQVDKGKPGAIKKVNLGRGRRPIDFTGPYFLPTPWLTTPARGNKAPTTLSMPSPPASASKCSSKLSTRMCPSFKIGTMPVGRKSPTLSISGSPSFCSSKAKTSQARARRRSCALDSSATLLRARIFVTCPFVR